MPKKRKPVRRAKEHKTRPRAVRTPHAPYSPAEVAQLEDALRFAEARFAGIVGISADAIITIDGEQRIVLFNRGAEHIFGYRADEIIGRPLAVLLPDPAKAVHSEHVRYFAETGVSARHMGARRPIEGRRRSGEIFPAEASITQMNIGGRHFYTAVLRDETERARLLIAERAARAAAEVAQERAAFLARASGLLDESLDVERTFATLARLMIPVLGDTCVIDVLAEDGSVRRVAAEHVAPEMEGAMRELRHFPLRADLPFLTSVTLLSGRSVRVANATSEEVAGLTQNGDHLALIRRIDPASYLVLPLLHRDRVFGAIAFVRCGTPQPYTDEEVALAEELARRAAQALENARLYGDAHAAIRARDDVLAVVSHDLRNPLAAIQMCATTLIERPPKDMATANEILGTISESVEWMNRIIQDLLDITSIEAGRLAMMRGPTTGEEIVARARPVLEALAREHDLRLEIAGDLPLVDADLDRIVQVLANLVGNAVKYTPAKGEITLRVEPDGDSGLRFTVRDRGSGIPPESLPHIFERFWHDRRDSGLSGTGLGLAIARGIVEGHGGAIAVDSAVGRGSTFWFTIPEEERPGRGP